MRPEEVFQFLLALALTPVIATIGYRVRVDKARIGLGIAFGATLLAYAFALVEHLVTSPMARDALNALQHVSYTAAGIALVVSAVALRSQVVRSMNQRS